MDIHFQHFASLCPICGDKIGDHKRKLDTNRFVSEIQQMQEPIKCEKIYYCWIFQTFIHRLKKKNKNKEKRQISTVNDVFLCSLNTDNLGCILT